MKKADIPAVSAMIPLQVDRPTAQEIREFRKQLGMTQKQFSSAFNIPLGAVCRWEQGQDAPRRFTALNALWRKLYRTHRSRRQRQGQEQENEEPHSSSMQSKNFITAGAPLCGSPFFDINETGTTVVQLLGV
jgi:hypothetical protein